jgi:hypothetical protein
MVGTVAFCQGTSDIKRYKKSVGLLKKAREKN